MWRLALLVLVVIGCNRDVEREAKAAVPEAPAPVVHVAGVPHSANIREIAATEQGDAAVSMDVLGGLRLWTALDGSREPVPISAPAPAQIAVAGTAFEVCVGVLDQSGSAHVLRFGRDGVARGRAQIAGDVGISRIVAFADHLMVLRADQSIEEIDAAGVVRSRLAADPGERIAALAVRSGRALAVLANDDGTASSVRWIEHTGGLAWGLHVKLPAAVDPASIALSPSHTLLAAAEAKSQLMFIYDLSVQPALATPTDVTLSPGEPVGFTDDHDVVALSPVRWWTIGPKPADPWAPTTPPNPVPATSMAAGSAANGLVVSGFGADLALVTGKGTRYLGWADMNPATATLVGDHIAISMSDRHYAWLDRSLAETRTADLVDASQYGIAIDDRHVVAEHAVADGIDIQLVDFDHVDHPVKVGHFASVHRLQYEPHTQMLFIDEYSTLRRYRLDLSADTVTERGTAKLGGEIFLYVVDPAVAGGAVAILGSVAKATTRLDALRDDAGTLVRTKLQAVAGTIVAIDDRGGVWWRERNDGPIRHGEVTLPPADSVLPDHEGSTALASDGTSLALYGSDGKERWRVPAWRSYEFQFTADDRQVLVHGLGGLMLLDAATGQRVAAACGWRFGIRDTAPETTAAGVESVCEDSGR